MSRLIKIVPSQNLFRLNWMTDIRCNYNCSYCPDYLHSSVAALKSLEDFKSTWQEIFAKSQHLNLKYKISFTGGEVTTNRNFLPFLYWLDENYREYIQECGITTNGSASTNYYIKMIKHVNWISFSTHTEFFDKSRFVDTIIAVNWYARELKKSIHVNIMKEPWALDVVDEIAGLCKTNFINYSVNPVYEQFSP